MLTTTYRAVTSLTKLKGNPRTIRDKSFKTLCDSLLANPDYFEARPLILSDRTGELVILAGNQRYEAAKAVGLAEVPTILLPDLTEEREREIIIRDNVNNGQWDVDMLANEWDQEQLVEWGVEVAVWNMEAEPSGDDLLGESRDKPATMKITFTTPMQLQQAEIDIQELIDRKYNGAYFSVSLGEA